MVTQSKAKPEYMTPDEAAAFLGLKLNTLYRLALDRRIPSYKIGKMRRFSITELRAWMESHRVEARGKK